jgi:hypothetical protein
LVNDIRKRKKENAKLSLGLINYEPHYKDIWGSYVKAPTILTSA